MTTSRVLIVMAEHLAGFELPEPVMVTVRTFLDCPTGAVQLAGESLSRLASELLAWSDTLDEVTATAWWPPRAGADQVHLEVHGRLPDGTEIDVFGGVRGGPQVPGLTAGCRVELSWALLRIWAGCADGEAA